MAVSRIRIVIFCIVEISNQSDKTGSVVFKIVTIAGPPVAINVGDGVAASIKGSVEIRFHDQILHAVFQTAAIRVEQIRIRRETSADRCPVRSGNRTACISTCAKIDVRGQMDRLSHKIVFLFSNVIICVRNTAAAATGCDMGVLLHIKIAGRKTGIRHSVSFRSVGQLSVCFGVSDHFLIVDVVRAFVLQIHLIVFDILSGAVIGKVFYDRFIVVAFPFRIFLILHRKGFGIKLPVDDVRQSGQLCGILDVIICHVLGAFGIPTDINRSIPRVARGHTVNACIYHGAARHSERKYDSQNNCCYRADRLSNCFHFLTSSI